MNGGNDSARIEGLVVSDVQPGYSIESCHTKSPLDVIHKALKDSFKSLHEHVLTKKYLEQLTCCSALTLCGKLLLPRW